MVVLYGRFVCENMRKRNLWDSSPRALAVWYGALRRGLEWTERFLKALNSTKVGIGFADYDTTGWDSTQESVVARLRLIEERGYTRIAVFHLNTSKGIPQPFYWPLMKGFLQGSSASEKIGGCAFIWQTRRGRLPFF